MLKKSFSLIILCIFILPLMLQAWDAASHVYLSGFYEEIAVWEDFDPEFYQTLMSSSNQNPEVWFTARLYFIGTVLPDMFDKSQNSIQEIITSLYNLELESSYFTLKYGFAIRDNTYNNIQTKISFGHLEEPNQNLEQIRQMVEYAKNSGWSPRKKALIYGCYMHLLQDLVAHTVLQPATFGYGRSIDPPEMAARGILESGEFIQELYTATYIPPAYWPPISVNLFSGVINMPPLGLLPRRAFLQFYWETNESGDYYVGWQDSSFVAVRGFVEAANATQYNVTDLTHDRLRAYMHGWGLSLFLAMGYRANGSDYGAIFGHPDWTPTDIVDYIAHIGDESIVLLNIPIVRETIGEFLEWYFENLILFFLGFVIEFCTGNEPWVTYNESVDNFEELFQCVPSSMRPDEYESHKKAIQYYQDYSTEKKPHLRSTYADQLEEGRNFTEFIKGMIDGEYTVWYGPDYDNDSDNERYVWIISRKAGLLGGMYDVNASEEYYYQPGIFDMHFESEGNPIYYIENEIPSTIELEYELIAFGNTIVSINGKKEDGSWDRLVEEEITQTYTFVNSSISLDAQQAFNNGYTELFFEVRTKSKTSSNYQTMFLSDYEEAFNSTTYIRDNQLYKNYFTEDGIPRRSPGQDPIADPEHYWPYALSLIPENLVLQDITVVSGETRRYLASNSIQAAGDNTAFIILNGGEVTMKAGSYICLKPGFEARTGCEFAASIDPSLIVSHSTSTIAFLIRDARFPNKTESKEEETYTTQSTDEKESKEAIPKVFSCAQNLPNPFMRNTTIKYGLPKNSNVKLAIYNSAGQIVRTLVNGQQPAGFKTAKWDGRTDTGREVPQGIYFYVFQAEDDFIKKGKMIVVR